NQDVGGGSSVQYLKIIQIIYNTIYGTLKDLCCMYNLNGNSVKQRDTLLFTKDYMLKISHT
ncbi:unnamed protein product, partial [Rotaria sp. Silwood1]